MAHLGQLRIGEAREAMQEGMLRESWLHEALYARSTHALAHALVNALANAMLRTASCQLPAAKCQLLTRMHALALAASQTPAVKVPHAHVCVEAMLQ